MVYRDDRDALLAWGTMLARENKRLRAELARRDQRHSGQHHFDQQSPRLCRIWNLQAELQQVERSQTWWRRALTAIARGLRRRA
jgi:hypothetical protein